MSGADVAARETGRRDGHTRGAMPTDEGGQGPNATHANGRPGTPAPLPVEGTDVPLVDAHCHLDLFDDPVAVAREGAELGVSFLGVTVTPVGYRAWEHELGTLPNVRLAAGLHPWWLADGRCGQADVGALCALAARVPFVGEVGLDLSPRRLGPDGGALQLAAFRQLAEACARVGGRVLSIHAVRSATAVLDILQETGCLSTCACVFHWFSGTGDELVRARRAGAWFSVGERSLATRKGRAYARQYPRDRLLLETDLPPTPATGWGVVGVRSSLLRALGGIEAARGELLADVLLGNASRLLGLPA